MDKYEAAAKSLGKLRRLPIDHPAVIEELNEVQANHMYEMSLGKSTYMDCVKGTLGKRLLTGCLLQSLQQLTGVNFIFCKFPQWHISFPDAKLMVSRLWNTVLCKCRLPQPIHHFCHHQLCKCRIHFSGSLYGRAPRKT